MHSRKCGSRPRGVYFRSFPSLTSPLLLPEFECDDEVFSPPFFSHVMPSLTDHVISLHIIPCFCLFMTCAGFQIWTRWHGAEKLNPTRGLLEEVCSNSFFLKIFMSQRSFCIDRLMSSAILNLLQTLQLVLTHMTIWIGYLSRCPLLSPANAKLGFCYCYFHCICVDLSC